MEYPIRIILYSGSEGILYETFTYQIQSRIPIPPYIIITINTYVHNIVKLCTRSEFRTETVLNILPSYARVNKKDDVTKVILY